MAKIFGVHTPLEVKNHFINGGLDLFQEKEGTTTTVNTAATTVTRFADMFAINSQGATSKNYSVVQSTDVPTLAQSGYKSTYSQLFTMLTGIASPAASDWVSTCQYSMEGLDYQKLHSKTVTFGFWVKTSIAGTYSFALGNAAGNRSYVTTFTMNGAATWEFKTITVTLDSTGTYNFDTGTGLLVYIASVAGSTFQTSSLNQWQAGTFFVATGATNWQATTNATFQITQMSMVEGPLGFGSTGFARKGKDFQQELALCQRYYFKTYPLGTAVGAATGSTGLRYRAKAVASGEVVLQCSFPVTMRPSPTCTNYSTSGAVGRIRDFNAASDVVASIQDSTTSNATCWNDNAVVNGNQYGCLFVADARL